MKKRKKYVFSALVISLFCAGLVWLFQFTSVGWLFTIQFRGYTEKADRIFINSDFQHSKDEVMEILESAKVRVADFWGELSSRPTVIISDDKEDLRHMGWTGNPALTTTVVFFGAHNYVLISPEGLNVDVAAHELTHAELHKRLYQGRIFSFFPAVPLWFDEGVALQNDWREGYSVEAWAAATGDGVNLPDMDAIATSDQFYVEDKNVRRAHYLFSKFEVTGWITEHGKDQFLKLIDKIRIEGDFKSAYYD
jgi:hypothetical protein